MTALVVFDIEAIPDLEMARRLLARSDGTADAEIRRMLGERYSRAGEDPATAFLKAPITGLSAWPPSMPSETMAAALGR